LLGGFYLEGSGFPFLTRYLQQGRRLTLQSFHHGGTSLLHRFPFLDLPLLEKALALSRTWLRGSRIYRAMLLREFPELFASIPWEKTDLPISAPAWREKWSLGLRKAQMAAARLGLAPRNGAGPAARLRLGQPAEFLRGMLDRKQTVLRRFLPYGEVEARIRRHFRGYDESEKLGRYLTAEIWLRKLREYGIV
jgi:hypothetical protein